MSMEHGVSTSTVKTSHGAHGTTGHGKNQAAATPGGFASVLSSLGAEEETLDAISQMTTGQIDDKTVDTDADADLLAGEDADTLLTDAALTEPIDSVDGQVVEDEDPAQTAAAAAAALAALGIDLMGASSAQSGTTGDSASTLAALAAAGGVAAIAGRQGAANDAAAGPAGVGARAATALTDNKAGAKDAAADVLDQTGALSSAKQSGTQGVDLLGAQRQAAQRNQSAARADAVKADAARGKGEDAAARLGWRSEAAAQAVTQAATTAGATNGQLQTVLVQGDSVYGNLGERGEEKFRTTVNEFAALGAVTASTGGTSVDAPVLPVAPDSGLTTEMQVAEQVTYWVGRGARDAEISVEGLTENPIHISIALQGQEASVAFRAEQEDTRQVLQDSVPHLRELLEREGLALADVSVGSSNPGWSGGSEASAQAREQAANRVRLGSLQQREDVGAVAQGAARATPLPAGRSLDLFV